MTSFDKSGFYREVGLRLQLNRKRAGLTQEDLATNLDMPRSSYANIERGRQRAPADVLWRAAIVLDVEVANLLPEAVSGPRSDPNHVPDQDTTPDTSSVDADFPGDVGSTATSRGVSFTG